MGRAEKKKRFTSEETASFCDQIAMLLNSGIPLYEGAYILAEEVEDKRTKQVLMHIEEQVRENMPLFEALSNTGAFPDYMVHMVKVGETTGKLEDVLKSLAAYYERDAQVKDGIRSAVAFPVILFAMMAVIMLVMVFKIIPLFEGMFLELSAEVASSTKRMMDGGILAGKIMAGITCALLLFMFTGDKASCRHDRTVQAAVGAHGNGTVCLRGGADGSERYGSGGGSFNGAGRVHEPDCEDAD